jgi:hypothetical protein
MQAFFMRQRSLVGASPACDEPEIAAGYQILRVIVDDHREQGSLLQGRVSGV